jgi:hypothetical protein
MPRTVLLLLLLPSFVRAQDGVDKLPVLNWPVPREWLNVKDGCGGSASTTTIASATTQQQQQRPLAAVGDGLADDTAAIQACFDQVSNETKKFSVYIPAGTYKVTSTLRLFRGLGILIIGQGESTRIEWGGDAGGRILVSDGLSRSRFVGLVFDGRDTAAVGFEHDSHRPGLFETRIRHQNNKFVNFLTAGIRIGHNRTNSKLETSEVLYENSIFANIGNQDSVAFNCTKYGGCGAVAIENFNDCGSPTRTHPASFRFFLAAPPFAAPSRLLVATFERSREIRLLTAPSATPADDNTFDGCHFFNNSWGIVNGGMANVYVRNSRFDSNGRKYSHRDGPAVNVYEGADIALAKSAGNSVRRCVSVNSTRFVVSPGRCGAITAFFCHIIALITDSIATPCVSFCSCHRH